jgi:hypothetical protein
MRPGRDQEQLAEVKHSRYYRYFQRPALAVVYALLLAYFPLAVATNNPAVWQIVVGTLCWLLQLALVAGLWRIIRADDRAKLVDHPTKESPS